MKERKSYPSPETNKPFMKKLQNELRRTSAGVETDSNTPCEESAVVEFDQIYKPYVFHILKDVYHFRETTTHSAEDIYHDVLIELLDGFLARFDFDGEHVGQGAFRSYFKRIIQHAYYKHVFPLTVPELDKNGDPIYLDEYEKDRNGKIKRDENGKPIRKVKRISRTQFLSDQAVQAKAEGAAAMFIAQKKPHEGLSSPVVQLAVIAYIKTIYSKEQKGKAKWRLEAMKSIFEDGRDPQELSEELQKSGVITDRRAFDTAKSIFMSDWEAMRYALQEPVIESTVGGDPIVVNVSKSGKVDVKLPKDVDAKGKGTYSRTVRRRLKVDQDELLRYIKEQRREAEKLVGKDRVEKIQEAVKRTMLMCVQEADAKEAEKRARHYN